VLQLFQLLHGSPAALVLCCVLAIHPVELIIFSRDVAQDFGRLLSELQAHALAYQAYSENSKVA
jgi:hypothetical protein